MFFSLLSKSSLSKRPVILFPGFLGSELYANFSYEPYAFYCKKSGNEQKLWLDLPHFIPPFHYCIYDLGKVEMKENFTSYQDAFKSKEGVNVYVKDFGGVSSVRSPITMPFGIKMMKYYDGIIDFFLANGYKEKEDLFAAPYDWRFGMLLDNKTIEAFKSKIEESYLINKQRATLIAHSMGCDILNYFLYKHTTKEWRDSYVYNVVYITPAFGGASNTLSALWRGFPYTKKLTDKKIVHEMVRTLPAVYCLMPNPEVFPDDKVLMIGKNGEQLTAKDLPKYFRSSGVLSKEEVKVMDYVINVIKDNKMKPQSIDLDSYVLYNSGIKTNDAFDARNNSFVEGEGDWLLNSVGAKYACKNWDKKYVKCIDFNNSDMSYSHRSILQNQELIDILMSIVSKNKISKQHVQASSDEL